jgi:mRNA interferase HigB
MWNERASQKKPLHPTNRNWNGMNNRCGSPCHHPTELHDAFIWALEDPGRNGMVGATAGGIANMEMAQDAAQPLRDWAGIVRRKAYAEHLNVRRDFPTADFIGPRKVVFNICGNRYRLVVDIRYDLGRVYIRHLVTHQEYHRLIKRRLL